MAITLNPNGPSTFSNGVSAGAYNGDGSTLTNVSTLTVTGSGAISDGDTLFLDSEGGKVYVPAGTGTPQKEGTITYADGESPRYIACIYEPDEQRFIICYKDNSTQNGQIEIGSVSGGVVTFGSPVVFASAGVQDPAGMDLCYDPDTQKIVIVYQENSGYTGMAIVGDVSGNTCTFGTAVQYASGSSQYKSICYDTSDDKVIIAWRNNTANPTRNIQAIAGTVSGTSISFGTPVEIENYRPNFIAMEFDQTANVSVCVYAGNGSTYSHAAVAISSSSGVLTVGTRLLFGPDGDTSRMKDPKVVYDPDQQQCVAISYLDNSSKDYPIVLTSFNVSGTTLSVDVQDTFLVEYEGYDLYVDTVSFVYNTVRNKYFIFTRPHTGYRPLEGFYLREMVYDGSTFDFATPNRYLDQVVHYCSAMGYDPDEDEIIIPIIRGSQQLAIAEYDYISFVPSSGVAVPGNSIDVRCVDVFIETTTVVVDKFLGFASGSYADGETVTINRSGVYTTTGLTAGKPHYLQVDGSLDSTEYHFGNTSGNSITAGTAISSTELLINQRRN